MARGTELLLGIIGGPAVQQAHEAPLYFASGTNSVLYLDLLTEDGIPVGIAMDQCRIACLEWLLAHANDPREIRLFVDSGAYSEFKNRELVTKQEWKERYRQASAIALAYGPRASIVLPDKIGDQQESLKRLRDLKRSGTLSTLLKPSTGAELFLPVQKGSIKPADYFKRAAKALGVPPSRLIPAIPYKAKAYTDRQVAQFAAEIKPSRLHLLGIGPEKAKEGVIPMISQASPTTNVSIDSVMTRGKALVVGGARGEPKDLTLARYEASFQIDPQLVVRTEIGGEPRLDQIIRLVGRSPKATAQSATGPMVKLVKSEFTRMGEPYPHTSKTLHEETGRFLRGLPIRKPTVNWDHMIDKVGELVFEERIGTRGRRGDVLSQQSTRAGYRRMSRGAGRTVDEFIFLQYLMPDGKAWTPRRIDGELSQRLVENVPSLTAFGAGQVYRALLSDPAYLSRMSQRIYRQSGGERDQLTPDELVEAATEFAKRIERQTGEWEWSSTRFEEYYPDNPHPANDLNWLRTYLVGRPGKGAELLESLRR